MNAVLWENAPATKEVLMSPVRAILLAKEKLAEWEKAIGHIDALMPLPEVSAADKMTLGMERMNCVVGIRACENIIQQAEAQCARQSEQLKKRWGWML